jgi:hypothetical protein
MEYLTFVFFNNTKVQTSREEWKGSVYIYIYTVSISLIAPFVLFTMVDQLAVNHIS